MMERVGAMALGAGSGNLALREEARLYAPGGLHISIRMIEPPLWVRPAKGAYIWDEDGKRDIDYHAAFAPIILGRCYSSVVERVAETIGEADLYGASTTHLELALAKKIVAHVPSVDKVLLCCTGGMFRRLLKLFWRRCPP
ncbi:MAG: aminotransferase class III-fold pyridoxal phosphate-dependent enzyme [Acetobacteraceae bacterium]